jgi:hypothetical protein
MNEQINNIEVEGTVEEVVEMKESKLKNLASKGAAVVKKHGKKIAFGAGIAVAALAAVALKGRSGVDYDLDTDDTDGDNDYDYSDDVSEE